MTLEIEEKRGGTLFTLRGAPPGQRLTPLPGGGLALTATAPPAPPVTPPSIALSAGDDDGPEPTSERMAELCHLAGLPRGGATPARVTLANDEHLDRVVGRPAQATAQDATGERMNHLRELAGLPAR